MTELHFLRPLWLLLLPVGAMGIWWYSRLAVGHGGAWMKLVDPRLRAFVLVDGSGAGSSRWPFWVALLAVVIGGLALAGPAWDRQTVPVTRSGDAMVIAMDLSRSMDATDLAPSRLARARLKLKDILRERAGGETALVVFSANAFVVTPLTDDADTIDALVPTLNTNLMPSRGSYPESGIVKSVQLLKQADISAGRILLVTDGGNIPPAITAARELRAAGHTLSVLAIGTEEGGPIPQSGGGFLTDASGNIALPKVDVDNLRRVARAGGGRFSRLTTDDSDLAALQLRAIDGQKIRETGDEQAIERWLDMGPWLLLLILPMIAFAFRRGGFVLAACLLLMPFRPAEAFSWDDMWKTPDQQAQAALEAGDAALAAALFEDPEWQAAARFQAGEFGDSAAQFAGLSGTEAAYNAGTALAKSGDFDAAIKAYESVLEREPGHEDARYNLELLKALQQDQQENGESGDGEGEPQDGENGDGEDGGQSEQSGSGSQGGESDDGGSAESEARAGDEAQQQADIEALQQAMREAEAAAGQQPEAPDAEQLQAQLAERSEAEQQQALEQWLRRVPDDPGGLLRRKFRYQYQRRQTDQDGNRLWPDDRSEPW